jgi:hypothetical protein
LFLGLLVIAVAPLGAVGWMCSAEPCFWQTVDSKDPEVQREAEQVERSVSSKLTRVRPDEKTWKLRLSEAQINRWLATRLPKWLENRGVKSEVLEKIHHPIFEAKDGLLRLAAEVSVSALFGVVQVGFEPRGLDNDRPVRLKLTEARIGRLPISVDLLTKALSNGFGVSKKRGRRYRRMLDSIEMKLPLGDGRRVDVVGLEPREDGLVLNCRTVWVEGPRETQ